MDNYVQYLLKDIAAAHRKYEAPKEKKDEPLDFDIEEHFREVERFLEGPVSDEHTFAYYTGLKKEAFPAVEKLTQQQQQSIAQAFQKLLASWGLVADLPKKLPSDMLYTTLISVLEMPLTVMDGGSSQIDFCDYDGDNCKFKDYCTCNNLDFYDDDTIDQWIKEKEAEKAKRAKQRAIQNEKLEKKRKKLLAKLSPKEREQIFTRIAKMEKYLDYLIQDINEAIENVPPSNLQDELVFHEQRSKELMNVPYKTIEEWTGISYEALANEGEFTGPQVDKLVLALDRLWEAYHLSFDIDDELDDPIIRYRMYLDSWLDEVQFLPSSGFEIMICAADANTCRMGLDCLCSKDSFLEELDDEFFTNTNDDATESDNDDLPF